MDEFGPDEQQWLDVLRAGDEPSAADRARVRASVLAMVAGASTAAGATTGAALAGSSVAKSATGATSAFAGWKLGVIAVVSLVVAGGGGAAVLLGRPSASAALGSAQAVAALPPEAPSSIEPTDPAAAKGASGGVGSDTSSATGEPTTAETSAETAKAPSAPPSRARGHAGRGATPPPRADDVDAELVLLTQAQEALKRGDPSGALQVLARHGREHPHGALAVERDGLRAIASCEAKRGEGRALAERFVARNPSSPLVTRVRAACLSP
jgi:hypothetical protein